MSFFFRNKVTLLICDMAGTIINEKGLIYKSLFNVLDEMKINVKKEDMKSWHGSDKREVLYKEIYKRYKPPGVRDISPLVNEAEEKLIVELEKNYFKNKNIELIDKNLLNFFDEVRINGIKIALNTGYPMKFQKKIIDHFNLDNRIDAYISSEEVKFGRPHPYMIHRLMEECDIPSVKNVAKIGDTVNDMLEGKNAGCALTIGVLSGADNKEKLLKHSDMVINKITDLRNDNNVPVFLL